MDQYAGGLVGGIRVGTDRPAPARFFFMRGGDKVIEIVSSVFGFLDLIIV